jgi:PAS domain-containing protein
VGRFSVDDLGAEALRMMRAGRPYVVNDIDAEASARIDLSKYLKAEVRALMCAPLNENGHYVARMDVSQKTPRHWEPWEIRLASKVANRCWESVERARAARNLRESEERYRAFIANSSEAIWRFELEQPIPINLPEDEQIEMLYKYAYLAECNDAMASMYGYERADQLVGVRVADLLPRSDPRNMAYLRALTRSGYRLTDAEMCEVDKRGNTKYFLSNQIGIVENKAVIRGCGTIHLANESLQRMLGVTLEQMIGRNLCDFFPPKYAEQYRDYLADLPEGQIEMAFRRVDGRDLPVRHQQASTGRGSAA